MRAAVLYGKEDLRIEEVSESQLKPGEVRLRIEAALTCGTDLKVFKRGYHAKMIVPPSVFGHELAGAISEISPGVNGWTVGDRVVAANSAPCGTCYFCRVGQENLCEDLVFLNGAYAESVVIPSRIVEKNLVRLRDQTSFAAAALAEPLACVVQGLEDCRPKAGDRVLVIGSGPISLMFLALARHAGCEVFLAGRGAQRMEKARALGARGLFEIPEEHELVSTVRAQSDGLVFDQVIEAVGKPATWQAALSLVRKGGVVNFFGGCPSGTSVSLDTGLMHYSSLRLLASFHHRPSTIRQALSLIESGVVPARFFIDGECALAELPGLFRKMVAGNHAVKTVVRPDRKDRVPAVDPQSLNL